MIRALLLWLVALSPVAFAQPATRQMDFTVPMADAAGQVQHLQARICRPAGDTPARLVLINHGSPPRASDRPTMRLRRCGEEATRWFTDRGYVVGFVLRRGYGETGGYWAEDQGGCSNPDFVRGGIETARDMQAAVASMTQLPFVRRDGAIIVGQSAGGWGAIAYDSVPHPGVVAFVVMAGGRGGHKDQAANNNCRPDLLEEAAGRYGATARTPMLWIYAGNDSFFAPEIARAMYQRFTAAGGQAQLVQPSAFGRDGHGLFFGRGGSAIWGPFVEQYLQGRGAGP